MLSGRAYQRCWDKACVAADARAAPDGAVASSHSSVKARHLLPRPPAALLPSREELAGFEARHDTPPTLLD